MTKWIAGLLLLANLALFAWMRWGSALTAEGDVVPAALNPDKIRLLQDTSAASAPASAPAPVTGMSQTSAPVSAPPASMPSSAHTQAAATNAKTLTCAEWGEFSGDDLSRAQQSLALLKLGNGVTQRVVEHDHGYWVYLPPQPNRNDVEKKIAQLKERGVQDLFVVKEKGQWQNAISLGVFRNKDAADRYVTLLRSKDVHTARVGERMSKLRFTVFDFKDADSGTLGKLNALQKEFPDSELRQTACNN